jgi:hypothetical protein
MDKSIRVSRASAKDRMDICKQCDRLFAPSKTCKECGCFMSIKVWVPFASCPLGKWNEEDLSWEEFTPPSMEK